MMAAPEPDGIAWHTSSYSGPNGGCTAAWQAFLTTVTPCPPSPGAAL